MYRRLTGLQIVDIKIKFRSLGKKPSREGRLVEDAVIRKEIIEYEIAHSAAQCFSWDVWEITSSEQK